MKKKSKVTIEHCSEPKCPACNLKAYNQGRKDTIKQFLALLDTKYLEYCRLQNGMSECKNCGLSIKDLKIAIVDGALESEYKLKK